MLYVLNGKSDCVERLLQEPRVLATIDAQILNGEIHIYWIRLTALHFTCGAKIMNAPIVELLLQAGANPLLVNMFGETPLDVLRRVHPTRYAAISLLEAAVVEPQRTFLLAKSRHQIDTSHVLGRIRAATQGRTRGETMRAVLTRIPGDLKERAKKRQALPLVELQPAAEQQRAVLEYVLRSSDSGEALGGMEHEGLPAELFVELLDMMTPQWDPLRGRSTA